MLYVITPLRSVTSSLNRCRSDARPRCAFTAFRTYNTIISGSSLSPLLSQILFRFAAQNFGYYGDVK